MHNTEMQEEPYLGLMGLDKLNPSLKVINFVITTVVGIGLAFFSWYPRLYNDVVDYQFSPFTWPLIFLFAWPLCAIILWLRITGIRWFWSFVAGIFVSLLYYLLHLLADAVGNFMA